MSASDNLSTKCAGLLLRSAFAILAARARHLISVARLSNSSDISLKDMCLLPSLVIRADVSTIAVTSSSTSSAIRLYRVPEIVTRGRFPDGGESDSTWRTQEARHVGSDTIAPGF